MPKAKITKTSINSAVVEPLEIRSGISTRLVFKPQIVKNANEPGRPIKGDLLWQKRGTSTAREEWEDECDLKLSTMKAGSGIKLALNCDEIYLLTQIVRGLYGKFWKDGKQLPRDGEEFEVADFVEAAKTLDLVGDAAKLIELAGEEAFCSFLRTLAEQDNAADAVKAISRLELTELNEINSLAGIGVLKRAMAVWHKNPTNADEGYWQNKLLAFSFLFSQVFSCPVTVFGEKMYVGGKSVQGGGGKEPDFLLQNILTSHVLIVEIKTPETKLLGKSPYRAPNVYAASRDVVGAVTQIARYKDTFLHNYGNLRNETEEAFRLADPKCLVVVGNTAQLDSDAKRESFEFFRRGLRSTEIITFDELFKKTEILLHLLEGRWSIPA